MKIKDGFVIREVMGSHVVIALGDASRDFHGMLKLNETAARIWGYISEGKTKDEMLSCMLECYDVDKEKLRLDIESSIKFLENKGFIEA